MLNTPPTAEVTIPISSNDVTEGATSAGSVTFTPFNWDLPQTITVSGVDDAVYDQNVNYTVSLGAAISSDVIYQGVNPAYVLLLNVDDDPAPTKFYVVNDASQNRTYEYNPNGGLVESYNLNSGNAAPRGAASSIAGDKTWVVDANRKVYVYNSSGALFGSWTAGTLPSNATVEGIATNGVDVWIVDAKSDKVYRYNGAAGRLTGSQNAASSFSLNSANANPKDIVTDGQSLWIVNDASADKVFKYNLTGSLLGSWTIATSGAGSPTGITIDPANVNDIWIVDNGSDKVYQYASAATRTSGSATDVASFALAAGNTNPQGIADPPDTLTNIAATDRNTTTRIRREFIATVGQLIDHRPNSLIKPRTRDSYAAHPATAMPRLTPLAASQYLDHRNASSSAAANDKTERSVKRQLELWSELSDEVLAAWS